MSTRSLHRAVAMATGEPLSTIRRVGFGLDTIAPHSDAALALVLDCPFCGRAAAYPGRGSRGEPALAECLHCDVYFDFADDEVYVDDGVVTADGRAA